MIHANSISKTYKGFSNIFERILYVISLGLLGGSSKFLALKDISFHANSGEILGIIGRNGAGKSTLLKILSGVSDPDSGSLKLEGSIRPMLELGVGFNPELTARENVFFNGLLWGYTIQELKILENEIFEFAGLSGYENQILKNFSTGMIMRLGFSLATANRPDILLIDEALAVGDASFQVKCIEKFKNFIHQGTTIIVVSHDLQLLSAICNKILVIEKGVVEYFGSTTPALQKYIEILGKNNSENLLSENLLNFYSVILIDQYQKNKNIFLVNEDVTLQVKFCFKVDVERVTIGFQIDDSRGIRVFGINSYLLNSEIQNVKKGEIYLINFSFPLNFREGKYTLGISIHKGENHTLGCYLWKDSILDFEIERINIHKFDGLVYLSTECNWTKLGEVV